MGGQRYADIRPLTALRFFAAFHVLAFHSRNLLEGVLAGHDWVRNILASGPVSVSLFFVLSGFVLTYSYLRPEQPLSRRSFWVARLARIYPVYLLALVVYGAIVLTGLPWDGPVARKMWKTALPVFLLVQAWVPDLALAWNSPGWSLSVEAFFYLAFPFALPVAARLGRQGLFTALGVLWAVSLLIPALLAFAEAQRWLSLQVPSGSNPIGWAAFAAYDPLVRLPEFLFGIALGRLFLLRRTTAPTAAASWTAPVVVGAVALVLMVLAFQPVLTSYLPPFALHDGLLAPLWGAIIFGLALDRGLLARLLSSRFLVLLGKASYALYLLHIPVRLALGRLMLGRWPAGEAAGLFLVYALVCVAAAVVVFRLYEEPARRLIRGRLMSRPA